MQICLLNLVQFKVIVAYGVLLDLNIKLMKQMIINVIKPNSVRRSQMIWSTDKDLSRLICEFE
jgi:hypothetical protein